MLQTIREHTQGWIAGVIISIIILTFALWGIHSYFQGNANNSIVAEVNGTEISKEQLAVAYERLRRQAQTQFGAANPGLKDDSSLKQKALQNLIDIEVLKQASLNQGFLISNAQIDNYLQNMPEFQIDGQFSLARFQEILSATLLSTSDFLDLIKTTLLLDQPKLGIIFTSFSLPDETNATISLVNQERDVQYINIPLQYFLSQPITIPADKVKAYYEQNQRDFMTPDQVNVEYLELSMKDLFGKVAPTDPMLKSFYSENINSYTRATAWKLAEIVIPIPDNASAEEVSKAQGIAQTIALTVQSNHKDFDKFSAQYAAKSVLTEKGLLPLSKIPAELQETVKEMTKPNQISKPIKTSKGFVILKVVEYQEPKIQTFDEVKDKVKEAYVRQHAEEKFAEMREQLANVTYERPETLIYASKNLNLPIQTSELFTKDTSGKDISQYKKVRDTAFSNDVISLQNNSDVIQLNPETVVVIRVKSHIQSALLPLDSIYKKIEDKLKAEEAETLAAKFAEDFTAKLKAGENPATLADTYKFTWVQTGMTGRYNTKLDSAILDVAFGLPAPAKDKISYGLTRLPNGYSIVGVKTVKPGVIADPKQSTVFAEQVQNSEGILEYELYRQSQTKQAKVEVTE